MDIDLIEHIKTWGAPAGILAGGLIIGLLAERIVRPLLVKAAKKANLEYLAMFAQSLKRMLLLWGILAGFSGALSSMPLKESLLEFLQNLPKVFFLFSLTVVLARLAIGSLGIHAKKAKGDATTISLFSNITKLIVYILGFLVILQSLGISITPILTALGVGGLAVALALQETLSNLFAGLHIIAAKQVKPGDYVRLETGEEGYVTDVTWRNTSIRAIPNNMVIVPNAKLASTIITNYHQPAKEMNLYIPVGVHYSSDLEHVERVTLEVAEEVLREIQGARPDSETTVRFYEFGGSSINLRIKMEVEEYFAHYLVTHEFIKRLHRRYDQEGIVIPFPLRTLHIPDSPEITVRLRNGDDRDIT
ncbi:MAG: mechanosensitive ion channel family protein [bacterium]|nr:MAG: mechanosensitive ion channel family protein [bacterium]